MLVREATCDKIGRRDKASSCTLEEWVQWLRKRYTAISGLVPGLSYELRDFMVLVDHGHHGLENAGWSGIAAHAAFGGLIDMSGCRYLPDRDAYASWTCSRPRHHLEQQVALDELKSLQRAAHVCEYQDNEMVASCTDAEMQRTWLRCGDGYSLVRTEPHIDPGCTSSADSKSDDHGNLQSTSPLHRATVFHHTVYTRS